MTDYLQQLTNFVASFAPAEALQANALGFTLDFPDARLSFFSAGGQSAAAYCRTKVAEFGDQPIPKGLAEDALQGNFFWRSTTGAVLSLNTDEHSVYLTDRFDEGAFGNANELKEYINGFLRTAYDWRERLALYGQEVAK